MLENEKELRFVQSTLRSNASTLSERIKGTTLESENEDAVIIKQQSEFFNPIIAIIDSTFKTDLLCQVNQVDASRISCENMKPGSYVMDFSGACSTSSDEIVAEHGTEVAGVIMGLVGDKADYRFVKVGSGDGKICCERIRSAFKSLALDDTLARRPLIINLSASYYYDIPDYIEDLNKILGRGDNIIFVCSAGNGRRAFSPYDSRFRAMLDLACAWRGRFLIIGATATVDGEEVIASYSNYMTGSHTGEQDVLFAPGNTTALSPTGVQDVEGTSFAAPIVSSSLALLSTKFPGVKLQVLSNALLEGAIKPQKNPTKYGRGIINIENTIKILKEKGFVPAEVSESGA